MRILTAADVRAAITMPEAIEAVRTGFKALSMEQAVVPVRTVLSTPDGITLYMPAYIQGEPISVVKVVSVYANNPAQHLPVVIGAVQVLDAATGVPLALMDGTSLTAIRTGAASGLATELLACPKATRLGIIGAGVQARTQVEAVCAVRAIEEVRIFSLVGAEEMAAELRDRMDAKIIVADTRQEALRDMQIICTATNSKTPVVEWADISPGVHINGVGSFTPQMQEIAADIVAHVRIIVDHRESAWEEAGDLIIPRDQGIITEDDAHDEIGEIAAGMLPGRTTKDEITFFKSVGNAVQDAAVAAKVLAVAEERNLGTQVTL